ncbi:serine hydrolase domain-containing protein [Veronia pacifica]|uniref:Beta-lactamase-related domain-containing protein n=1 Tax=Veronia pacifica TaxID=1080227 RepID=A0A1C3EKW2_9GAMM|nr:serine hydrolase [Veronia pacifica]ODA33872.1 hypothetical protein A8L45_08585 [Veronia pacifica]
MIRLFHLLIFVMVTVLTGCDSIKRVGEIKHGTGFSAAEMCSRLFVSQEAETLIVEDVIRHKVFPLTWVWHVDINREDKQVSVSAPFIPGLNKKTAVYREGIGCSVLDDDAPESLAVTAVKKHDLDAKRISEIPVDISASAQAAIQPWFEETTADSFRQQNTYAVLVMKNGKIIAEQYADGHGKDVPMLGWSMGKSLTALLAGVLFDQDKLTIDDIALPASEIHPLPVRVKHLLNMSSGLEWDEVQYSGASDASEMLYLEPDSAAYVATRPQIAQPGSKYTYSTGDTQLLAKFISDRVGGGGQAVYDFYQKELFHKLGIGSAFFEHDPAGTFIGGARPFLKPRDWLKIGLLLQNKGRWNGEQVISEEWIDYLLTPSPANPYYGGTIWLGDEEVLGFPDDMFSMRGHLGQYMTVIPSQDLVILRLGILHAEDYPTQVMARTLEISQAISD